MASRRSPCVETNRVDSAASDTFDPCACPEGRPLTKPSFALAVLVAGAAALSAPLIRAGRRRPERPRRLHGEGPRPARRELEEAAAVHPRRERAVRGARARQAADLGREARVSAGSSRTAIFVRSPLKANGVDDLRSAIGASTKRTIFEPGEGARQARRATRVPRASRWRRRSGRTRAGEPLAGVDVECSCSQTRQPQFIDSAYFLNSSSSRASTRSSAARRSTIGEVLRIEYYPARLFNDETRHRARETADASEKRSKDDQDSRRDDGAS